jgi:hypothetical protein
MARNITTCDWTKKPIDSDEDTHDITIGDIEYVFSSEGLTAMLEFLDGAEPMVVDEITAALADGVDINTTLLKGDQKALPIPTREAQQAALDAARRAPEGSLDSLSSGRKEAQKKLREVDAEHETLDPETKKRLSL